MSDQPILDKDTLKEAIIAQLKDIYDPEIPVNIYDLGLIYDVFIEDNFEVVIQMTLTAPGCPVAQTFPLMVADKVREVEGVVDAQVQMVWEPAWSTERMSEAAKLQLGIFE
jgi:FeS assembly SUF system protein